MHGTSSSTNRSNNNSSSNNSSSNNNSSNNNNNDNSASSNTEIEEEEEQQQQQQQQQQAASSSSAALSASAPAATDALNATTADKEEVEAGAWKLWAMTQTAIFVGVLLLFYLFSSAEQSLATAMILLTILHAMYEQACIRALCLRLKLLLLLLLAVDSLFQVPVPLFYSNNIVNGSVPVIPNAPTDPSMWRQICLGNATRVARFAQAAGIQVGLGTVALRPIVALLVIMALRQLLLSTWYQQLELLVADESTRTEQKGRAWVVAERERRATNIHKGEAELQQSRNRVRQLRKLLGGGEASVQKAKAAKNPRANLRTYFDQFEGGQGEGSVSRGSAIRGETGPEVAASEQKEEEVVKGEGYLAMCARRVLKGLLAVLTGSLQKSGLATRREAENASRLQLAKGRSLVLDVLYDANARDWTGHSRGALSPTAPTAEASRERERGRKEGEDDGTTQEESKEKGEGDRGLDTLWELLLGVGEALAATFSLNTHLVSYSAVVIWHCVGSLPASGILVIFILSVAAFQDPFPARWHWTVAMGYLVLLAACKILARLLADRFCGPSVGETDMMDEDFWLCHSLLPWWFSIAGDESGPGIGDFATLLVLAAHRANLQHRGLWRDVGILELAPRAGAKRRSASPLKSVSAATTEADAETSEEAGERGGGGRERGEREDDRRQSFDRDGTGRRGRDWVSNMKDLLWLPSTSHGEFGTGVDLYMLVVTPELLALLLFFVGILGSGAGAGDKLESLSQGGAVDWTTLGWVMLAFLQWTNIVVDRILYLRRLIWAKALMQIVTVLFFFAIFFCNMMEPLLVEPSPSFYSILYLLKCWYWVASAVQIRRGYPAVTRENYFFKDFSYTSSYLYIVYSVIPFLMDMRGMLDWTCTPTTLDFYQWMKLEAIYAMLFQRQVTLQYRETLGRKVGQAQLYIMKTLTGLLYFVGLAIVIWAPLLVSVVSSKYSSPQMIPVLGVQLDVALSTGMGDRFELSSLTAVSQSLLHVPSACPPSAFDNVTNWLPPAQSYLASKALSDQCEVKDSFSTFVMTSEGSMWAPTPVRRMQLQRAVQGNSTAIYLLLQATYVRNVSGIPQASAGQKEYQARVLGETKSVALSDVQRKALAQVLVSGKGRVVVPAVLDPIVQLSADSATPLRYGMESWRQSVSLVLNKQADDAPDSNMWWSVCCEANSSYCRRSSASSEEGACGALWVLAAVDPGSVNVLSRLGLSLITIYTIFVLAIGRSVRSICTGDVPLTIYNELPAIDKLWALCSDIYTARHHGDLDLEEELFTFLVDIYRSPETLLQLTGQGAVGSEGPGGGGREGSHASGGSLTGTQGSIAVYGEESVIQVLV